MKPSVLIILPLLGGPAFAQTYAPQLTLNQPVTTGVVSEQKAIETIVASTAIRSGAVAHFKAGQSIKLDPGFVAHTGSLFMAAVEPVTSLPTRSDGPELSVHAYPNPFAEQTTVEYTLPVKGIVQHTLTDVRGRIMHQSPAAMEQATGSYRTDVNGQDLPAGVYLYHVQVGNKSHTLRLVKKP